MSSGNPVRTKIVAASSLDHNKPCQRCGNLIPKLGTFWRCEMWEPTVASMSDGERADKLVGLKEMCLGCIGEIRGMTPYTPNCFLVGGPRHCVTMQCGINPPRVIKLMPTDRVRVFRDTDDPVLPVSEVVSYVMSAHATYALVMLGMIIPGDIAYIPEEDAGQ